MKVIETEKTVTHDGRITQASVILENEKASREVRHDDLTPKFGEHLLSALNQLYRDMVKSNAKTAKITLESLNAWHGNDLIIEVIRHDL